jgi:flagellar biosynthesis protein FlhB
MADPQKTEQPTQKRLRKAREEGQFPSTRQFLRGIQFCVFVFLLQSQGAAWLDGIAGTMRALFQAAFAKDLDATQVLALSGKLILRGMLPPIEMGAVLMLISLAMQLTVTRLGISVKKLAPDPKRLNPLTKLQQLPRQNLTALVQAVIMLPLFCAAIYGVASEQLDRFAMLPLISVRAGVSLVSDSVKGLLWKAASLLLVFGFVELFREKRRQTSELRMTKQEVKDEHKETEGNPQIKAKIRALRRDQARKRMMKAVPKATAVIVNPTHYAVALQYEPDTMPAPLVVAKGKNYLAQRIRQLAVQNQVPLIENPPLARALYKSVDVGQEIPAHLYRAVAEILAYIFKIMNRNMGRR